VLELDHVIRFVPGADPADLRGFTPGPGRVHTGQGTRNMRVMFDRNYLEIAWIEKPDEVAARGLDFVARCARPATATPFGCVLRGAIGHAERALFVPYELPDAPGMVLHLLADQPADAPFVAVFDVADCAARWPSRHVGPEDVAHPNGATRIVRATFTAPRVPPVEAADVRFLSGPPRLELDLGGVELSYAP
jgi:hypothetical protein